MTKLKYKSISISADNHSDLIAIATELSDQLGITISANSAISVLIKHYIRTGGKNKQN